MMVKATEYYNLEKVAEVLSVPAAEVSRLREQGKLRGFRDGNTWKFQKEEVHTYLAESIRARSAAAEFKKPGESDFDLGGDLASSSSFDLLVEEAALPGDSDLVSVAPAQPKSDLDLAALDQDSDLALAEETQVSGVVMTKAAVSAAVPELEEDSSLALAEETQISSMVMPKREASSVANLAPDPDVHEVDLDDSESVLEAGGSSPQLGLAGDSGFDVLIGGEEGGDLVQVDGERTEMPSPLVEEFILEPSVSMLGDDDSESSSQVIAIDVGLAAAEQESDPFGGDSFADFMSFDSGVHSPAAPAAAPAAGDPFGGGASLPDIDTHAAPAVSVTPSKKAVTVEGEYSTGMMATLVCALVVMLVCGIMMIDTTLHLWSWSEQPFVLNSMLMGMVAGLFGL